MTCKVCKKEATREKPVGDCIYMDEPHCEDCCKKETHAFQVPHRWKPISE